MSGLESKEKYPCIMYFSAQLESTLYEISLAFY